MISHHAGSTVSAHRSNPSGSREPKLSSEPDRSLAACEMLRIAMRSVGTTKNCAKLPRQWRCARAADKLSGSTKDSAVLRAKRLTVLQVPK